MARLLLGLFDQLRYAHTEVLVDGHDFAARHQPVVHEQIDRTTGQAIQLNDRPRAELEDVAYEHLRGPELGRDRERDVHQQVEIIAVRRDHASPLSTTDRTSNAERPWRRPHVPKAILWPATFNSPSPSTLVPSVTRWPTRSSSRRGTGSAARPKI